MASEPTVRPAAPDEADDALAVLDAAMLDVERDRLHALAAAGRVLVAVRDDGDAILGAIVVADGTERHDGAQDATDREQHGPTASGQCDPLEGGHVVAIAVRRARRARGIGTALVAAAAERWRPLTADFAPRVGAFYEKLGFDVRERDDGRLRGRLDGAPDRPGTPD
ncbi:MAG: GNAT family N-acetyltransferase [Halarchaeum sp.]